MLSRSKDPVAAALDAGVTLIIERAVASGKMAPVILIDGRSGAGKSSLTRRLASRWPSGDLQIIGLDSLYPGWDGLAAGVEHIRAGVLESLRQGFPGEWHEWDWARNRVSAAHLVDPSRPLVIEGSGLLTPETAALSDVRVWVEADDAARKQRALERDGETYAPHWQRWAAQEAEHLASHHPQSLADVTIEIPNPA